MRNDLNTRLYAALVIILIAVACSACTVKPREVTIVVDEELIEKIGHITIHVDNDELEAILEKIRNSAATAEEVEKIAPKPDHEMIKNDDPGTHCRSCHRLHYESDVAGYCPYGGQIYEGFSCDGEDDGSGESH